MAEASLTTLICGTPAGTLRQDAAGLISFQYNDSYVGAPLSLSMPVSNRVFRQRVVVPYLQGLLPDSEAVRRDAAIAWSISPNNPVAMLSHMGLDCPGAVQFCAPSDVDAERNQESEYEPLTNAQIAERLRALRENSDDSWLGNDEHWSLGGNQGKFSLALIDGRWHSCTGAAATTHIIKNGVAGFKLQALDEFVCMKLAAACGIPTANVDYRLFEDEPAIIVERYDRIVDKRGKVTRLHQEDFCQALSVPPSQKYTADGGPTTADAVHLLGTTKSAKMNLYWFTQMLFFNCLIGAPDAHAKNYSLLLGPGRDALIAPMYDVASGLAYESFRHKGRLAMAIGGENRFGRVGRGAIERHAALPEFERAGIEAESCINIMGNLATMIPERLAGVFAEWAELPGMTTLRKQLEGPVAENCAATLALL